ncbi:putative transcription factor GRAS family [Dioscorea sansibarensis]
MQFSESAPPPPPPPPPPLQLHQNPLGLCLDLTTTKPHSRSWPSFPTSSKTLGTTTFNNASCMEQLLVHCATAIETNDSTLAQQILWVLNNIAPPDGDSNQRLTSAFLRALIIRASKTGTCAVLAAAVARADSDLALYSHRFSAVELASFIDLTPWYRFGFSATNSAITEAVEGFQVIHLVDLSTTHCMQIPTLIDMLANRPEGPPFIRLTIPGITSSNTNPISPPPLLDLTYDELGARLIAFARSRNIGMEFRVIPSDFTQGFDTLIEHLRAEQMVCDGEALVINCQMMLHYVPEETVSCEISHLSMRSYCLKAIRSLEPTIITLVEEDADFTDGDLVGRLRSAFNFLWIPYDAVDTFLPKGSDQRRWYEGGVCWKIENVIAHEGIQRVERLESRGRWVQRMRGAGFKGIGFGEEAVGEVKTMLDEHAAGWGLKKEDEGLVLSWKGHNVVFATAWAPC